MYIHSCNMTDIHILVFDTIQKLKNFDYGTNDFCSSFATCICKYMSVEEYLYFYSCILTYA